MEKTQKFKETETVTVVDRIHGHEFLIGETVKIMKFDKDGNNGK